MLRILGSPATLSSGLTRREALRVGSLGLGGLALADLLQAQQTRAAEATPANPRSFGQAKSCILLYLFGAASQIETFDVKPDAPVEVRGEFGTIESSLPGFRVCELLPRTAGLADRLTVVRSMTHPYPIHGSAYSITSTPTLDIPMQLDHRDPRHWPFIGSVVAQADAQRSPHETFALPRNVAFPWPLSSRRDHPSRNGGPYGAFLGPAYDPVWTEFQGQATREASYEFGGKITTCLDPYGGVEPDCRFELGEGAELPADITLDRFDARRSLLEQFDRARRALDAENRADRFDRWQQLALSILASGGLREALDISREAHGVRDRYGMTLFGQSLLAARRLIEAGGRFVTVFWDEFASVNAAWDTHYQHYPRMRGQLLPGFDLAFSALIGELEERGLLDETLVVCVTEHGRTPRIVSANGGGRDHWSQAYCSLLAGGGASRGRTVGRTDAIAGTVVDTPISPKDILATMYHLLGIDPRGVMRDQLGRPYLIGGEGETRRELLA